MGIWNEKRRFQRYNKFCTFHMSAVPLTMKDEDLPKLFFPDKFRGISKIYNCISELTDKTEESKHKELFSLIIETMFSDVFEQKSNINISQGGLAFFHNHPLGELKTDRACAMLVLDENKHIPSFKSCQHVYTNKLNEGESFSFHSSFKFYNEYGLNLNN